MTAKVRPSEMNLFNPLEHGGAFNMIISTSSTFCKQLTAQPWKWFYITFFGHVLAIIISLILWGGNYSIYPAQFGNIAINPSSGDIFKENLAWNAATSDSTNDLWSRKLFTQATRSVEAMPLQLIYRSSTNCLTKTNLRSIQTLETQLMNSSAYVSSICLRQADGTCRTPRSIMRFFDGSYSGYNILDSGSQNIFRADLNFDRISEIISTAYDANGRSESANIIAAGQPDLQIILNYVLSSDFNSYSITASKCRTMIYSGLPLTGYRTEKESTAAQLNTLGGLHWTVLDDFLNARSSLGDMELVYSSSGLEDHAEDSRRTQDYYLSIGSLIFLLLALWIQTHSLWIAFFSMAGSFGSYVWANLLYRIILNFSSFSDPQALSGYIVALLGAFHAVYLVQLFRRASNIGELQGNEARLSTALVTGHRAILTVNVVLMLSFFVSAASCFIAAMDFAVFCGLLCVTTYLSSVFYLPSVIITWHVFWAKLRLFRRNRTKTTNLDVQNGQKVPDSAPLYKVPLQAFFRGPFVDYFLGQPVLRWLLISASLIIVSAFLIAASISLRVDQNQPTLWRSQTNFGKFHKYQTTSFGQSDQDNSAHLYIIWGLQGIDDSGCHRSDLNCLPVPIYDEAFDMEFHTSQNKLLDFCKQLKTLDLSSERSLRVRRSATVDSSTGDNPLEVSCYLLAQQKFFNSSATPLPFDLADLATLVHNYPTLYTPAAYSAVGTVANPQSGTYYRGYEMATLHWLSNGTSSAYPAADYSKYSRFIGGQCDSTLRRGSSSLTYAGDFGDTIRYVAITVNLTINTVGQDATEALAAKDAWEAYLANALQSMPRTLQSAFVATPESQTWAWAKVRQDLFKSLCRGIALSLMFLLLGVTLATGNYIIGALATVTSLWIVFMLFGIMAFSGWSLGTSESVLFIMVVPLSAIFNILLAVAYQRAVSGSRRERLRIAMAEFGPVALFLGVVGLGTSVFLFGTQLHFSFQYGVVFFATLGLSGAFSLVFMATVLGVSGPRGKEGRLWDGPTTSPRRISSDNGLEAVLAAPSALAGGPSKTTNA